MNPSDPRDAFRESFQREPDGLWSAPGRVNLIGEHTDYNDGFVLPFAIDARTTVACAARDDGLLRMRSLQQPGQDVSVRLEHLAPGSPSGWAAYVAGVVWAARRDGADIGGLDVLVDGRVPPGGGLSSSHAIEVAVALATADLFGLPYGIDDLARLTQRAENGFVGAPTGLMDQLALLRGRAGHAVFLDIRSLAFEHVPLDAAAAGLALVVVDTRVHHQLGDGAYGNRRAACERAAAELGVASLRDVDQDGADPEALVAKLARLDGELLRRARHVVTENARVRAAVACLRSGDWPGLGELMDASHASLRDDYEVSCPELDVAVDTARESGALGARMTGGGFGGSAVAIVAADGVEQLREAVRYAFARRGWHEPDVFEVSPAEGARREA